MRSSLLIYGIGNPARGDDALGIALVHQLEDRFQSDPLKFQASQVSFDSNYQLNIEDALTVSNFETVIFIDAWNDPVEMEHPSDGFRWTQLTASEEEEVGAFSHQMSCAQVLTLCRKIYQKCPKAYLLAIAGKEWEINAPLSALAQSNLNRAQDFLVNKIPDLYA